jgi:RNA polymerase sigma-B factor
VWLTDSEREILRLRFQGDKTQAEIAERIGPSQMHVSRLTGAFSKLRERLGPDAR